MVTPKARYHGTQSLGHETALKVQAYAAGRAAWEEQVPLGSNPHAAGSAEARKWEDGWRAAKADALLHEGVR